MILVPKLNYYCTFIVDNFEMVSFAAVRKWLRGEFQIRANQREGRRKNFLLKTKQHLFDKQGTNRV
jgi:hypothetical protein